MQTAQFVDNIPAYRTKHDQMSRCLSGRSVSRELTLEMQDYCVSLFPLNASAPADGILIREELLNSHFLVYFVLALVFDLAVPAARDRWRCWIPGRCCRGHVRWSPGREHLCFLMARMITLISVLLITVQMRRKIKLEDVYGRICFGGF